VAIVFDGNVCGNDYYTSQLSFTLAEDTPQPGKRWVVVTPNPEISPSCAGNDYPALFRKNYTVRLIRRVA